MEITEVRIKLMDDPQERLQAFCSITFDSCFVIRDLKIIEGAKGSFVAMPSRKLTDHCPQCNTKNHLRACKDDDGRAKLYADIAHPINSRCREMIQSRVLEAFEEEMVRSKEPGYICRYDDYGEDAYATLAEDQEGRDTTAAAQREATPPEEPERRHRIESAERSPKSPHQSSAPRPSPETASASRPASSNDNDEGFGEGIL